MTSPTRCCGLLPGINRYGFPVPETANRSSGCCSMRARVRDNRLVDRWASLWGRQLVVRTRYRLTQRRVGELTSLLADVLQYNPLIGRSVSANTRELVIG